MKKFLGCVAVVAWLAFTIGCGGGTQEPPEPAPATTVPAAIAPAAATPEPEAPMENVLHVAFQGINDKGLPVVTITNLTGEDIDDITGGFKMTDSDGNILFSTGMTEAIPGAVFLARGETKETVPFGLSRKPELMELLGSNPGSVTFSFEARTVTFMPEMPEPTE